MTKDYLINWASNMYDAIMKDYEIGYVLKDDVLKNCINLIESNIDRIDEISEELWYETITNIIDINTFVIRKYFKS